MKRWHGAEPVKRLRGRAGQRQRQRRLQRTKGLCEHCLTVQRTRLATVVDHVVPLALGGLDVDANTRNLCDEHHAAVTREQFGHQTPEHRGVGADGRPIGSGHPWTAGRSSERPST